MYDDCTGPKCQILIGLEVGGLRDREKGEEVESGLKVRRMWQEHTHFLFSLSLSLPLGAGEQPKASYIQDTTE